jgi:hypothetical protein
MLPIAAAREPVLSSRADSKASEAKADEFSYGHADAKGGSTQNPARKRGAMFAAALGEERKPLSKEEIFDGSVVETIAVADGLEQKIEALRAKLMAAVEASCNALRDRVTEITGARTDALEEAKKAMLASSGSAAVPSKAAQLLGLSSTTLSGKAAKLLGEGDPTRQVPAKAAALLGLAPAAPAGGLDFSSNSSAAEPPGMLLGALLAKTDEICNTIIASTEKALKWEQRINPAHCPTLLDGRVVMMEDTTTTTSGGAGGLKVLWTFLEASSALPPSFGTAAIGWRLELLRDAPGTSAAPASGAIFASISELANAPPSAWPAELQAVTDAVIPLRQPFAVIPASTVKLMRQYGISAVEVRPIITLPRAKLVEDDDDDEGEKGDKQGSPRGTAAEDAATGGSSGSVISSTAPASSAPFGGIAPVRRSVKSLRKAAFSKGAGSFSSSTAGPVVVAGPPVDTSGVTVALEPAFAELALTTPGDSASSSAAAIRPARRLRIRLGLASGDLLLKHAKPVSRALPVADGSLIVTGDLAGHVTVFDSATATKIASYSHPEKLGITALCELPVVLADATAATTGGAGDKSPRGGNGGGGTLGLETLRVAAALENGQVVVLDFSLPLTVPSSCGGSSSTLPSAKVVAALQGAEGWVSSLQLVSIPPSATAVATTAGGAASQGRELLIGADAGGKLLGWDCAALTTSSPTASSVLAVPPSVLAKAADGGASINTLAVVVGSIAGTHVTVLVTGADDGAVSFFSLELLPGLPGSGNGTLQPQMIKKLSLKGASMSAHSDSVNEVIALSEDATANWGGASSPISGTSLTRWLVSVANDKALKLWKVEVTSAAGASVTVAGSCELNFTLDGTTPPACVAQLVDPSRKVMHTMRPSGVLIAPVSAASSTGGSSSPTGPASPVAATMEATPIKLALVQEAKIRLCELRGPGGPAGSSQAASSVATIKSLRVLQGHQEEIGSIAAFNDRLVSSASDCLVRLWSPANFHLAGSQPQATK